MKYKNNVLRRLDAECLARLALSPQPFELGYDIEFPGWAVTHVYFVEEGMASRTTTFHDGAQVEVGMFGYESVIGGAALMGAKRSLNRVYTQVAGRGYCAPIEAARREFARGERFHELTLCSVQAELVQASQSAACNAKHHLEQRLARWLLVTSDRVHSVSFEMSQEFLADMLGSTRSTLSRVASVLKDEGLIDYNRGVLRIVDAAGLQRRSCECYGTIKRYLEEHEVLLDRLTL